MHASKEITLSINTPTIKNYHIIRVIFFQYHFRYMARKQPCFSQQIFKSFFSTKLKKLEAFSWFANFS